jgi:NADH-quinone oxidoreductase subunit N
MEVSRVTGPAISDASLPETAARTNYLTLARTNPLVAVALTLFMVSLAGFPPTAGFIGKFVLFKAALVDGFYIIVVIAVLNSLVSVYYYLRVVVKMFMSEPAEAAPVPYMPPMLLTAMVFAVLAVLLLGIYPQGWYPFDGLTLYSLR